MENYLALFICKLLLLLFRYRFTYQFTHLQNSLVSFEMASISKRERKNYSLIFTTNMIMNSINDVNGNSLWQVTVSTLPDSLDRKPIKDSGERNKRKIAIEQPNELNECSVFSIHGKKD